MLPRLRIVLHDLDLVRRGALVLGGGVEVARAGGGLELDLFTHGLLLDQISPRWRSSASTTSMPRLSMVRRPALEMRRLIQRFSLSTQNRRYCRFGRNRRLVLLLAWDTLLPTCGFLPVTWQTRAMTCSNACRRKPKIVPEIS